MPKYIVSPRPITSPGWPHDKSPVECDSYRAAMALVKESLSMHPSQELYVSRVSGKFTGEVKVKRSAKPVPATETKLAPLPTPV